MPCNHTTLARFVQFVLDRAVEAGVGRHRALAAAGLDDRHLQDPDARISVLRTRALWRFLLRAIPDDDLGLRWGGALRARDAGIVGYAMIHSPDLGAALERLARYAKILETSAPPTFSRSTDEGIYAYLVDPREAVSQGRQLDFELAALMAVVREITTSDLRPRRVELAHRPPDLGRHRAYFGAPVEAGCARAAVVFPTSQLAIPVHGADDQLGRYLDDHAEQILRQLAPKGSLLERVERAMWATLKEGDLSVEAVARSLDLSVRSLQRQLHASGTSFSRLRDELRREMAVELIGDRTLAVAEVAYLLGYSEPATFRRAFRRWFGVAPRHFAQASPRSLLP